MGGWKRDRRAHRAYQAGGPFGVTPQQKGFAVPASSNLYRIKPGAMDQGRLGYCVAFGTKAVWLICRAAYGLPVGTASALFLGWARVAIEGAQPDVDSGMFVHDCMQFAATSGVPPEETWPYDEAKFSERPPDSVFEAAAHRRVLRRYGLDSHDWRKACLGRGFAFALGFDCTKTFLEQTGDTGECPYPDDLSEFTDSGHCVYAHGHDDTHQFANGDVGGYLCGNSWGDEFGCCVHGVPPSLVCPHCETETPGIRVRGSFWLAYKYFDKFNALDATTIHEETAA